MSESTEVALCAVCSDPADPDEAHWAHKPGCPIPALVGADHVPGAVEVRDALEACDCDLLVHPECCMDCREVER